MRFLVLIALAASCLFAEREVAITFDDLPIAHSREGSCQPDRLREITSRLLKPFKAEKIPLTAFVIAGNCGGDLSGIKYWQDAGAEIGNHTYSHKGLNTTPIAEYEQDILKAHEILTKLTGKQPRFFRSPMLQAGADKETKERLEHFLAAHNYRQGIVTFDNSDWMFSYVYTRALAAGDTALAQRARKEYVPYMESVISFFETRTPEVVGRDIPQVLLVHANELNADAGADLIAMLKRRGYKFITLEKALSDPAYSLPNSYAGKGGFSWIHRWSMTKGLPNKGEPDEPLWLRQAYENPSK